MPENSQSLYLIRIFLSLMLLSGSLIASAQTDNSGSAPASSTGREELYRRLDGPSGYDRREALKELLNVAPEDAKTVEVLIRLFQSKHAEENNYSDFLNRVSQALQDIAAHVVWTPANVELLTSILVDNDAYDARATNLTASTVSGVARRQHFSNKAISDLTTVLWHRVDKNPNRTRQDNTRSYVVQALRHVQKRQGLSQSVISSFVDSLANELSRSVRRETIVLIEEIIQTQPASDAMVQTLTQVLRQDRDANLRALAARALRHISEQRHHPRILVDEFQRVAAEDENASVRREVIAGIAAALNQPLIGLPSETVDHILLAATTDPDAGVRYQALQALGKAYAAKAVDPASLASLMERFIVERDRKTRVLFAATLREIHERQGLPITLKEQLIPYLTDEPSQEIRNEFKRILIGRSSTRYLDDWLKTTAGKAGLEIQPTVPTMEIAVQDRSFIQPALRAKLIDQFIAALSDERSRQVRGEIVDSLFQLSLSAPLPAPALDALIQHLEGDYDAVFRQRIAALLLHHSLQHQPLTDAFLNAVDDDDALVHDYAAFALVTLNTIDGNVVPTLLGFIKDSSAHRHLRLYALRRLAQWYRTGKTPLESAQATVMKLTTEPDLEIRKQAWYFLAQFDLTEADWRKATNDSDLEIQRLAWSKLKALGVAKPLWARWQDPQERLELVGVGLLGMTVFALLVGSVYFIYRLVVWLTEGRSKWGRMLAAQLTWVAATILTVVVDGGILLLMGLSHSGVSIEDLVQVNTAFSIILILYVAAGFLCWKLLPMRPQSPLLTQGG